MITAIKKTKLYFYIYLAYSIYAGDDNAESSRPIGHW